MNVSKERLLSDSLDSIVKDCNQAFRETWEWQRRYKGFTSQQAREILLEKAKRTLSSLIPEHRKRAQAILEKVSWPTGCSALTLKDIFGVLCDTCQDTGVSGYIFGIRCPRCNGK